ncbi:MAG: hypothetical protein KF850_23510 [Labilithrix sp.]|nr:hypothetical protein [Labilithrix sp.]
MSARLACIGASAIGLAACSLLTAFDGLSNGVTSPPSESIDASSVDDAGLRDGEATDPIVDPSPSLVYATRAGALVTRRWDASSGGWSAERVGPAVASAGTIRWVVSRRAPGTERRIVGALGAGEDKPRLSVFTESGDAFELGYESDAFDREARGRAFDVAFESASRRAVVVYGGDDGNPRLRTRGPDDTAWSAERRAFSAAPSAAPIRWVELVAQDGTDELSLVYVDEDSRLLAARWVDDRFAMPVELESTVVTRAFKGFAATYERLSGDLLVVWGGRTTPEEGGVVRTAKRRRSRDTFEPRSDVISFAPGSLALARHPKSDAVAISYLTYTCGNGGACDHFRVGVWDGSTFDVQDVDAQFGTPYGGRRGSAPCAVGWTNESTAFAAYHRESDGLRWLRWTGAWTAQPDVASSPKLPGRSSIVAYPLPAGGALTLVADVNRQLWAKRLDGTSWTDTEDGAPLTTDLATLDGVPFALDTEL